MILPGHSYTAYGKTYTVSEVRSDVVLLEDGTQMGAALFQHNWEQRKAAAPIDLNDLANRMFAIDRKLSMTAKNWNHNLANIVRLVARHQGNPKKFSRLMSKFDAQDSLDRGEREAFDELEALDPKLTAEIRAWLGGLLSRKAAALQNQGKPLSAYAYVCPDEGSLAKFMEVQAVVGRVLGSDVVSLPLEDQPVHCTLRYYPDLREKDAPTWHLLEALTRMGGRKGLCQVIKLDYWEKPQCLVLLLHKTPEMQALQSRFRLIGGRIQGSNQFSWSPHVTMFKNVPPEEGLLAVEKFSDVWEAGLPMSFDKMCLYSDKTQISQDLS